MPTPGPGQAEFYQFFTSADNSVSIRPFNINASLDNSGFVWMGLATSQMSFMDPLQTFVWMELNPHRVSIKSGTKVELPPDEDALMSNGVGLLKLGWLGSNYHLKLAPYLARISFGHQANPAAEPIRLYFGQNGFIIAQAVVWS